MLGLMAGTILCYGRVLQRTNERKQFLQGILLLLQSMGIL